MGDACTGESECRSSLCSPNIGQCVDVCSSDADCPASHRCKVDLYYTLPDNRSVYFNICLPHSS